MKTNNTSLPQGRRRVSKGLAVGLMLSALAGGGGILASGLTANPATAATATTSGSTTSGSTTSGSTTSGSTASGSAPSGASAATFPGLPLNGTVTAVGASTVTIGTTTYTVSSTSDIDKNGESTLSSLAVGDAVTFSTVTSGSLTSIDKLHAGSETLDRPTGGGTPPTGTPGAASSAGAAA